MLSHNGVISILLVTGSSTESCMPTLHVGLHQYLYLTLKSEWPTHLLHLTSSCQKGSALISDHVQAHHIKKALHLRPTSSCQKGIALTIDHARKHRIEKDQHLQSDHAQSTGSERAQRLQSDHA